MNQLNIWAKHKKQKNMKKYRLMWGFDRLSSGKNITRIFLRYWYELNYYYTHLRLLCLIGKWWLFYFFSLNLGARVSNLLGCYSASFSYQSLFCLAVFFKSQHLSFWNNFLFWELEINHKCISFDWFWAIFTFGITAINHTSVVHNLRC